MNQSIAQKSATPTAPHQAIYRRWRAQTFEQMVGQQAVVETLRNAVRLGQVAHAILFVGPRGTGKTSLARILAKALNCTDLRDGDPCDRCPECVVIREGTTLDVIEIDAASNRGINEIKELRDRLNYAPSQLRRKVYILDEAHQITRDAWNALLKSLEEPPDFVVFMFASTHPQDFPPAILSRLQRYDVRRLTVPEIEGKLQRILAAEERLAEPPAIHLIARLAAGGMRDAESMLDQLLASAPDGLAETHVRELLGLAEAEAVDGFIRALVDGDPRVGIDTLDALEERGRDTRAFLDQVVDALRESIGAALADPDRGAPADGASPHDVARLATAARRLAAIDPNRAGIGGLRLQLELALLSAASEIVPGSPTRDSTAMNARRSPAQPPSRARPATGEPRTSALATEAPPENHAPSTSSPMESPKVEPATTEPPGPAVAAEPARIAPSPRPARTRATTGPVAVPEATVGDARAAADPASPPTGPAAPAANEPAAPAANEPAAPAANEPAAPAANEPAPISPDGDLERLRDLWPSIVAHISQHPPTKPLIAVCRPIAVEGNVVTLGFPEDQAFLREVATRRRPNLEDGIGQFLGHSVSVRCVATNLDRVAPVRADADAEFVLAEARRIFADEPADVGEVG
ncbi:MAG: DNA polymerase III subunit gamma/tau [Chloroflexota bacterium]